MEIDDAELDEEFQTFGVSLTNTDLIDKLKELCASYRLDASSIALEWVAFSHSRKHCDLNLETLDAMERDRLMKKGKQSAKTPQSKVKKPSSTIYDIGSIQEAVNAEDELLDAYSTPTSKRPATKRQLTPDNPTNKRLMGLTGSPAVPFSPGSFSPASDTPSQKYSGRTNAGQTVCSYGSTTKMSWRTTRETPCIISPADPNLSLTKSFKYMFQKLTDKAHVLNDMIEEMGASLRKHHDIDDVAHVALPAQDQVTVVGRICCDSNGKLNAKSVVLEGSRESSAGRSIPVDLSDVKQYSMFPGQIVAMDGINSNGAKFAASNVYEGVLLPKPEKTLGSNKGLRVVVSCGPYTTTDSLMYEPLADLIKVLQKDPPDVCIMLGPFVDVKNPEIEKGTLNVTYEEFFLSTMEKLASATQRLPTQLVIVPSQRDVHHNSVYPQPPFNNNKLGHKHVHFVSDPCTLSLDGVVFGVTSTDILFHLGGEEISFPPGSSDRLGRLTKHLLTQHNYYPLYPPHEDMNVDYDHFEAYSQMTTTPHVLVVPSDLRYFVKDISGCVCVNPGRLSKGQVGGTYTRLVVLPSTNSNELISNNIAAEVVRI